jgi:hypothetical protein
VSLAWSPRPWASRQPDAKGMPRDGDMRGCRDAVVTGYLDEREGGGQWRI